MPTAEVITAISNPWAEPLYHYPSPYDYLIVHGGRGSSKTFEITKSLIVHGHMRPMRIAVAREHLKSIEESAKPELETRAQELKLLCRGGYEFSKNNIDHANGTHFLFLGLSKLSEEDIKGLALVDILWIEEAHRMSHYSWELIRPTIRKDNALIIVSYNRKNRTDAIDKFLQKAIARANQRVWAIKITWRDNQFFTARNERERLDSQQDEPERYPHMWEGEYDDVSDKRKVLPRALLQTCVDAWPLRPQPRGAFADAGFDVADTGEDRNCLALRAGPELWSLEQWRGRQDFTVSDSTRKVAGTCHLESIGRLHYDAGGLGAGVRGPLIEEQKAKGYTFRNIPCQFGGEVQGADVSFIRGTHPKTNKQYFFNWVAQAGWGVRLRAENTQRLVNAEKKKALGEPYETIDPHKCLFINPQLARIDDALDELAQPEWDDGTGKLKVNKQPHEPHESKPASPNAYDAVVLAFSSDAKKGLVQRVG